jgi:hypothetical protein
MQFHSLDLTLLAIARCVRMGGLRMELGHAGGVQLVTPALPSPRKPFALLAPMPLLLQRLVLRVPLAVMRRWMPPLRALPALPILFLWPALQLKLNVCAVMDTIRMDCPRLVCYALLGLPAAVISFSRVPLESLLLLVNLRALTVRRENISPLLVDLFVLVALLDPVWFRLQLPLR